MKEEKGKEGMNKEDGEEGAEGEREGNEQGMGWKD